MRGTASPRLLEALDFAVSAHGRARQARRGTAFPYVIHPLRVAEILSRHALEDEELAVAGLLHDTVEDTDVEPAELERRFGKRVARLVAGASEPDKTLSWSERKEHTIEAARTAPLDVLTVVAADKLDNVRSLRESLADRGAEETWAYFNAPEPQQRSYYTRLAEVIADRDPGNRLFQTLAIETDALFPPPGRAAAFFHARELRHPAAVRPFLGDPQRHWRPRYSAYELAHSWIGSGGVPATIRDVLDTADPYRGCELVEGWFERETDLGTPGRPSQTDVLALVRLANGDHAIVGVEGKAREPFGPLVGEWNTTPGKDARLEHLCAGLGLNRADAGSLRYQLLHRTAAALIEARRYGARHALMLVHSFAEAPDSLADYRAFAEALGLTGAASNALTSSRDYGGVELRLGWVGDRPRAAPDAALSEAAQRLRPA